MTDKEFEALARKNPMLRDIFELGLAENWRYSAKPVFSKTGKGFLRSAGVSEIAGAKEADRADKIKAHGTQS